MARIRLVGMAGLGLCATACTPEFTALDEACPERVFGERHVPMAAGASARRVACYRRLVGLKANDVNPKLAAANRAHVAYLSEHFENDLDLFNEAEGQIGFTGRTMEERAAFQGYSAPQTDHGWFEIVGGQYGDPEEEVVDYWLHDPELRQFYLQPAMMDFAYGANNDFVVMSGVYAWPPDEHAGRPVLYPADGQAGLPRAWVATPVFGAIGDPDIEDVVVPFEVYGYPITLTFGSAVAGGVNAANPLEIFVRSHRLSGPEGDVDTLLVDPAGAGEAFRSTVVVVPVEPLAANAEYTVEAEVEWMDRSATVTWSFTTAE